MTDIVAQLAALDRLRAGHVVAQQVTLGREVRAWKVNDRCYRVQMRNEHGRASSDHPTAESAMETFASYFVTT